MASSRTIEERDLYCLFCLHEVLLVHLEKGVGEGEVVDFPHLGISRKFRVHIEEHRHVDLLPWPQLLLLKTEALDLVEVGARLLGGDIVGGYAYAKM